MTELKKIGKATMLLLSLLVAPFALSFVIWVYLVNDGSIHGMFQSRDLLMLWIGISASAVLIYFAKRKTNYSKKVLSENLLEDSHFMTKGEIKNAKDITITDLNKISTVSDGIPINANFKKRSRSVKIHLINPIHTLIVGTTRTGKTSGYIEPTMQILARTKTKPSMIIADPKGELYNVHAKPLQNLGYTILLIDLMDIYRSTKWNPFADVISMTKEIMLHSGEDAYSNIIGKRNKYVFRDESYLRFEQAEKAQQIYIQTLKDEIFQSLKEITETMCPTTDKNAQTWQDGARDLILALLLGMWEDYRDGIIKEEQFNLFSVYKNIALYCNADIDDLSKYFATRSQLSKARDLSTSVLVTQDKTLTSYITDIKKFFSWMADTGIASFTSKNELDIKEFDERPTALFLRIPDSQVNRHKIVPLLLTQIYKGLVAKGEQNERENKTKKGKLLRNCYYILDEFGNIPQMPLMDKMITVGAGRGIYFVPVIQDYAQLDNLYGKNVATIIKSNCNIKMFIGSSDPDTIKAFSAMCGKQKVRSLSYSQSKDVSTSFQAQERPVISDNELWNLNTEGNMGNIVITALGKYPIKAKFEPAYKIRDIYQLEECALPKGEAEVFEDANFFYDIKKRNDFMDFLEQMLADKEIQKKPVEQKKAAPAVAESQEVKNKRILNIKLSRLSEQIQNLTGKLPPNDHAVLLKAEVAEMPQLIEELVALAVKSHNSHLQFELMKLKFFIEKDCLPYYEEKVS